MEQAMLDNIQEQTKQELAALKKERAKAFSAQYVAGEATPSVRDIYQERAKTNRTLSKKHFPKGSSSLVSSVVASIVKGGDNSEGLARAYRRAKDNSNSLKRNGDKAGANLIRQQYLEEHFLPAIEVVVNYTSPDEVLNNRSALDMLDKYSIGLGEDGNSGYTESYIRESYGKLLGMKEGKSDPKIVESIARIKSLSGDDQIRTAVGLAKKIKKDIDEGRSMASDDDYDFISRVSVF